jgi:DeoR family glycerol-3-phosphate regulon repressor
VHRPLRHAAILRALKGQGACRIRDLAGQLQVSGETVRRDIIEMAREGLIKRVHGGASLLDPLHEPSFSQRMETNAAAKQAIAQLAAAEVRNGDTLMLDTGSTTAFVAHGLVNHRDLLVVTNSVDIARTLATRNGNRVFMAGGELRADDGAALGPTATEYIAQFHVRVAILSAGAVDAEEGLMDYDPAEAAFSRVVIAQAERTIVVADHSKFGRRGLVGVCRLEAIDLLITDQPPPPEFVDRLSAAGVTLRVPEADGR